MPYVRIAPPYREVAVNTTLTTSDTLVYVNASLGAVTITLPDISASRGLQFVIKKKDSSANAVTIVPQAGQTIDGNPNLSLTNPNDSITLYAPESGTDWKLFSGKATLTSVVTAAGIMFGGLTVSVVQVQIMFGTQV